MPGNCSLPERGKFLLLGVSLLWATSQARPLLALMLVWELAAEPRHADSAGMSCGTFIALWSICHCLWLSFLGAVSSQLGIPTVLSKALRFLPALWPYTALQGELCPWQIQLAFPLFKNVSVSS